MVNQCVNENKALGADHRTLFLIIFIRELDIAIIRESLTGQILPGW